MVNFLDINYLQYGNERQRSAYQILSAHKIMEKLGRYIPILVGTIPIEIDLANSDLDIICEVIEESSFIKDLHHLFAAEAGFSISRNTKFKSVKANFTVGDFEIEIFWQNLPTIQQNGYRHMLVEYKILQERDEDFKQEIIRLKSLGYKTEPAFAKLLNLEGDPYEALLRLK
jgi:hypothetical protein